MLICRGTANLLEIKLYCSLFTSWARTAQPAGSTVTLWLLCRLCETVCHTLQQMSILVSYCHGHHSDAECTCTWHDRSTCTGSTSMSDFVASLASISNARSTALATLPQVCWRCFARQATHGNALLHLALELWYLRDSGSTNYSKGQGPWQWTSCLSGQTVASFPDFARITQKSGNETTCWTARLVLGLYGVRCIDPRHIINSTQEATLYNRVTRNQCCNSFNVNFNHNISSFAYFSSSGHDFVRVLWNIATL